MLGFFRARRHRRLQARPTPPEWIETLQARVPFYAGLEGELKERFFKLLKVFVWDKTWIGAGGMEITDEVRVVVSAAAVRLVLHLDERVYDRLSEIVIYPSHYKHPDSNDVIFGEAHAWGIVVLSWDAVLYGLANPKDGHDTVTHEFAHVLDRATGSFDGTPPLRARADYRPWALVLSHHFAELRDGKSLERHVLRDYAATNEAEFFAVATESFFEKPQQMLDNTPELYEQLKHYYGFDPAAELRVH